MMRTLYFFCFLSILALRLIAAFPADAQTLTTLHSFNADGAYNDGTNPLGMIIGTDGNFYGITSLGGTSGNGTVFKATPLGAVTILHSFSDGTVPSDGAVPLAALVQGADGSFYGTTYLGGSASKGTIFKMTSMGVVTILHQFGDGTVPNDGNYPFGIVPGADGNFYGITNAGGASNDGTVYKLTPGGIVTVLYSFTTANGDVDDIDSACSLIQGRDGNFYGTFEESGSTGEGLVFKLTPTGGFTALHTFGDGMVPNDGTYPAAPLVQSNDGAFYGTTEYGGSMQQGVAFRITPTGTYTILHNFGDGTIANEGNTPDAALIVGRDGNLYGTTAYGGAYGNGSAFDMTPAGVVTVLYSFSAFAPGEINSDGAKPFSPLVQTSDGKLYGTTAFGGTAGGGTIFRLNISPTPLTITSLDPESVSVGGPAFTLTIFGTNFTNASAVTFAGAAVTITARSATQLKVTVPASAITTEGTKTITVSDPSNGSANALLTLGPPLLTWSVQDVAAVSDGTARLLWDRGDGAAGIWILSAANTQTAAGPTYGPYQGWTAQDITAAGDGTSRILWNRYDGATGVWAMDARGNQTSVSPTYGPFSGWKAIDLAAAPDGTSRLMWRYTNGEAGILTLNATGGEIIVGRNYGPYTGWTATAVGAAGDGTARMLWTRSDGAMGLWTMDANDLQKAVGPTYGPYSDNHGTWRATDLSTSSDGTSQVLWKRSDGAIGVWTFSASNTQLTVGSVYGPYVGFTAAALDAANDKARILWVRSDRAAGLWSFGSNDLESLIGPVYGPY